MGLRNTMLATGDGFIDRLICVVGAVVFAQTPEFIQQYLQRLGGHVDEIRRQVEQYRQVAAQSNLTLDQLIAKTNSTADAAVSHLGQVMSDSVTRLASLEGAQTIISQAPAWERPFVFLKHVDLQIAHGTLSIYHPALPITLEGFVYALAGMLLFLGLYHVLVRVPVRAGYRRAKRPRAPKETVIAV